MKQLKKISSCLLLVFIIMGMLVPTMKAEAIANENPRVIITSYGVSDGAIAPGETSTLNFKLKNTSKTHTAHGVLVTVLSDNLKVYPVYSTSNQRYIEEIKPGEEASITMDIEGSVNLDVQSVNFSVNMLYQDDESEEITNSTIIQLPVSVEKALVVSGYYVPETAAVNNRTRINATIKNSGAEELTNVQMIVQVDGEEQAPIDIGTVEGKGESYRDTYIEFTTTGTHSVMLTFTYSDAAGHMYTTHTDIFQVNVVENADEVSQQEADDAQDTADDASSSFPFASIQVWQICLVAGILVVIIIIIVLLRRDRH